MSRPCRGPPKVVLIITQGNAPTRVEACRGVSRIGPQPCFLDFWVGGPCRSVSRPCQAPPKVVLIITQGNAPTRVEACRSVSRRVENWVRKVNYSGRWNWRSAWHICMCGVVASHLATILHVCTSTTGWSCSGGK